MHGITDEDIERWPQEELTYLQNSQVEPKKDAVPVVYVEALLSLNNIS